MNYLVLGTILDDTAFASDLAANPASTKWLSGFAKGLLENDDAISLCGHCYTRAWPKGTLFPGKDEYLNQEFDNYLVRFINIPGVRFSSMARGYYRVARSIAQNKNSECIVTYNPYPWNVFAARKLRKAFKIPWICLHLDFDDVGSNWSTFLDAAGDADGHLFLSHWGFNEAPVRNKIHLDSGISSMRQPVASTHSNDQINIVYLGKLSKSGGLEVLLELPDLIKRENVRFIYGGKASSKADARLKLLAQKDSRVNYLGFVDEGQLNHLFELADIFLNPRDPDDIVNDMVFPSKIMNYLQHEKTIVSTWTRGLEPAYKNIILFSDASSSESFAAAVQRAISESNAERKARGLLIGDFLRDSRLWSHQAKRFSEFTAEIKSNFEPTNS